jgi:hypothetical protein
MKKIVRFREVLNLNIFPFSIIATFAIFIYISKSHRVTASLSFFSITLSKQMLIYCGYFFFVCLLTSFLMSFSFSPWLKKNERKSHIYSLHAYE